ncbi:DUF6010 family protein [Salinisphaera orenii]|uniref:DUF6010 family protein n=1 Tax=Salinisphaera orenii TaxID=856731 RepID=UPI000DBE1A50
MKEALVGIGVGVITCSVLLALPIELARDAAANLLTLIASIYVGFGLASNNTLGTLRQVAGCTFFVALALLGLWVNWWFLVIGLLLHGVWDYLHHGEKNQDVVPRW